MTVNDVLGGAVYLLILWALAGLCWIANIFKIAWRREETGWIVLRVIGIFIPPLGVLLGIPFVGGRRREPLVIIQETQRAELRVAAASGGSQSSGGQASIAAEQAALTSKVRLRDVPPNGRSWPAIWMAIAPIAGLLLLEFWFPTMRMIDNPMSKLYVVGILTLVVTVGIGILDMNKLRGQQIGVALFFLGLFALDFSIQHKQIALKEPALEQSLHATGPSG